MNPSYGHNSVEFFIALKYGWGLDIQDKKMHDNKYDK